MSHRDRELAEASGFHLREELAWVLDELTDAWRAAQAEAALAYEHWRETAGGREYAAYRASQDRADAAQDALSEGYARARGAGLPAREAATRTRSGTSGWRCRS